jgi:hypothetical protein
MSVALRASTLVALASVRLTGVLAMRYGSALPSCTNEMARAGKPNTSRMRIAISPSPMSGLDNHDRRAHGDQS